jgi:hypothetical protein
LAIFQNLPKNLPELPRNVLTINCLGNFFGKNWVLEHTSLKSLFFKKIKAKSLKTKIIQKHKKYLESTNIKLKRERMHGSLGIDPLKTARFPKYPNFSTYDYDDAMVIDYLHTLQLL